MSVQYQELSYNEEVKDEVSNEKFKVLGKVTNPGLINTLAVTDAKGGTWFFCLVHMQSYHPAHGFCAGCRNQVREEPTP